MFSESKLTKESSDIIDSFFPVGGSDVMSTADVVQPIAKPGPNPTITFLPMRTAEIRNEFSYQKNVALLYLILILLFMDQNISAAVDSQTFYSLEDEEDEWMATNCLCCEICNQCCYFTNKTGCKNKIKQTRHTCKNPDLPSYIEKPPPNCNYILSKSSDLQSLLHILNSIFIMYFTAVYLQGAEVLL